MGLFDVDSQRRVARLEHAVFLPVSEVLALPGTGTASGSAPPTGCCPPATKHLTTAAHHLPAGAAGVLLRVRPGGGAGQKLAVAAG